MTDELQQPFEPDELLLVGDLQVSTALSVLAMSGVNPEAEGTLEAFRMIHVLGMPPEKRRNCSLYLQGQFAAAIKADIIVSAELAAGNEQLPPDQAVAVRGLLAVLAPEKYQDS